MSILSGFTTSFGIDKRNLVNANPSDGADPNQDGFITADDFSILDYLAFDSDAWAALWRDISGITRDQMSFQHDIDMQEMVFEEDKELKRMEMDYNSEVNQLARLKEAGLNPALMTGLGGSTVSGSSVPSVGASDSQFNPLQALLGITSLGSRLANDFSTRNNLDADTNLKKVEAHLKPLSVDAQVKLWESESKKYVADAGLSEEDAKWIATQRGFFQITSDTRKQELEQTVQKIIAETNKLKQEEKTSKAEETVAIDEHNLYDTKKDVMEASAESSRASAAAARSQVGVNTSLSGLYGEQTNVAEKQANLMQQEYDAVKNMLGGLPLSVDGQTRIAALLSSHDMRDIVKGQKLLQGVLQIAEDEYNQMVRLQMENYWNQFALDVENGVSEMPKYLPFMFMGSGKPTTVKGFRK